MPRRWLILADDLTGAADCAIAFTRRGLRASVGWGNGTGGADLTSPADATGLVDPVLAIDADSRRLSPGAAAARHRALLQAHHKPGLALIKKLDSTLRGQPAAELAETVGFLRAQGSGAMAIVAPAFPATGRTTEGGCIRLNGAALESTSLWVRDHSYPNADLVAILDATGLRTRLVTLDDLRGDRAALTNLLHDAVATGIDAVICDAVLPEDLLTIARASLPLAENVFWAGSGGLAVALAGADAGGEDASPPIALPNHAGGILVVVGSVAEASRAAAAQLQASNGAQCFSIPAEILRKGAQDPEWQRLATGIAEALRQGQDVLVDIAADPAADLSRGAELAERLAALLAPAATRMGGLFATGGETACALLSHLGVHGIRLVEELEPGVPLGVTLGALTIPVMTKAGAFGDAGTIARSVARLRAMTPDAVPPALPAGSAP